LKRVSILVSHALGLLLCTNIAFAQEAPRIAVELEDKSGDALGGVLVYKVREHFRQSSVFRMTIEDEPRFKLIISSMDPMLGLSEYQGLSTAYSVVVLYVSPRSMPIFVACNINSSGGNALDIAATQIVANLDAGVEIIKKGLAAKEVIGKE
jgi:hypothetical protein